MLTIGYLGNGKSTNRYHLPFVLQQPDLTVKAIYARSAPGAWPTIDGVTYTNRMEDVLEDDAIDLVVITTPLDGHVPLARTALEHGKNVLVEKPFSETADEARELFALAKSKGLFLQCYQNRRFDSDYLTTKQVIESGVLGELLELEMHYDYFRPEVPEGSTFSLNNSYLYGHACHTLDQVLALFGTPKDVHLDVRQLLGQGRMNDYFDLDLYYDHPLKVSVKSSYFRITPRPSFVATGTRGRFEKATRDRQEDHLKLFYMPGQPGFGEDSLEDWGTLTHVDDEGRLHERKVPSIQGDYGRVYRAVYESIVNGAPKVVTDEQTIAQLEILEQGLSLMRPGR